MKTHLSPLPKKRTYKDLEVITFIDYEEIEDLLKAKYEIFGSSVYKVLAEATIKPFFNYFQYEDRIDLIAIDDNPDIFSHTAILTKCVKSKNIKPLYNVLRTKNKVQYAGKDLLFRESNPRGFYLNKIPKNSVILVDDIVTTGTTLLEAKRVLEDNGVEVLFAMTVAFS
jgi:competence protein ComFC